MAGKTAELAVVDASFVLSFLLPDESLAEAEQVFADFAAGTLVLVSTPLLEYEVTNGLRTAAIRGRITQNRARELAGLFTSLTLELRAVPAEMALETALSDKLTVYDASYLTLARILECPLLTLDDDLKIKAKIA